MSHKPSRSQQVTGKRVFRVAFQPNSPGCTSPLSNIEFVIKSTALCYKVGGLTSRQDGEAMCVLFSIQVLIIVQARDEDEVHASAFTLQFKYAKYTVLLFAEPLTPFITIKTNLLAILKERYPGGLLRSDSSTPTKIPDSILDIVLGVPIDQYDPSKGWDELDTRGAGIKESPKSLGLKDGSKLAMAFVEDGEDKEAKELFYVEYPDVEALYPEDE
jgi:hypothetical protein